jgi:hypothetical protein
MRVKAQVLLWSRRSSDDETYTNYQRSQEVTARLKR